MSKSSKPGVEAWMRHNPPRPSSALRRHCVGEYAARHGGTRNLSEAAPRLGVVRKTLVRVFAGRRAISPELSLELEAAGWGNARSWT